jgi:hypothetical protein
MRYEVVLEELAKKFKCSETHIRRAVAEFDSAKEESDAATRE